jgi:hypothetical protein
LADQILNLVNHIVFQFFGQCDTSWLDQLYDEATDEELFEQLLPKYRSYFSQTKVARTNGLFDIFYYGAFECILGAFLRSRHGHENNHPICLFIRIAYDFHLEFWDRAEQRRMKAIDEEFEERRQQYASPDEHLENCADLSPAEKTRVFKQGLHSRNKVGGIHFDQQHRTDEIIFGSKALKLIEKIFTSNPAASPADLLKVMDGCLKLHRDRPTPKEFKHGVLWHARTGHRLINFAKNLSVIIPQLQMTASCPITSFLGDVVPADEDVIEVEAMAA